MGVFFNGNTLIQSKGMNSYFAADHSYSCGNVGFFFKCDMNTLNLGNGSGQQPTSVILHVCKQNSNGIPGPHILRVQIEISSSGVIKLCLYLKTGYTVLGTYFDVVAFLPGFDVFCNNKWYEAHLTWNIGVSPNKFKFQLGHLIFEQEILVQTFSSQVITAGIMPNETTVGFPSSWVLGSETPPDSMYPGDVLWNTYDKYIGCLDGFFVHLSDAENMDFITQEFCDLSLVMTEVLGAQTDNPLTHLGNYLAYMWCTSQIEKTNSSLILPTHNQLALSGLANEFLINYGGKSPIPDPFGINTTFGTKGTLLDSPTSADVSQ